jgi:aldose 1-epimerase
VGDNSLELTYLAKDKEEGYPGNLKVKVTYTLTDTNHLVCHYEATTDKTTPVNLTQHTYFNLKGEGNGTILDHQLMINAKKFTPVDETLIPTGELKDVKGTPFDFTEAKAIGRDIEVEDEQLTFGGGYDHNWVLEWPGDEDYRKRIAAEGQMTLAARVKEPTTGRVMEVFTTEPGIQFYCGNFLDGRLKGKSGQTYVNRGGLCLETQHYPDSPNQPNFPSTLLKPGEKYDTTTVFKFSAE